MAQCFGDLTDFGLINLKNNIMAKFELGYPVADVVTGFTGVIIARSEYLYGSTLCLVQATTEGDLSKFPDSEWIEEERLTTAKLR